MRAAAVSSSPHAVSVTARSSRPFSPEVSMTATHDQHEDFPWTLAVVDHPKGSDSPASRRSRTLMRKLVATILDWALAGTPSRTTTAASCG